MDERQLWSMEYFVEQGKGWFIDFHTNDLYELDLESGQLEWITCYPAEGSQFKSHPLCVKWQNDIFAIPDFGENIWIYRMETGEFSKIPIGKRREKRYGSRNPIIQGDDIWVPVCGQLDIQETRRILHINARTHQYEWSGSITENGLCLETVYKDGYVYLASSETNILYVFDTGRSICETYCIEELGQGIETVCSTETELWFSDHTGKLACWDMGSKNTTKTAFLPFASDLVDRGKVEVPFLQSRYVKGKVCYIPAYTNPLKLQEAIVFDPDSLSFQTVPIFNLEDVNGNYVLVEFVTDDGKIGIWTEKGNRILLVDIEQGQVEEKKQILSKADRSFLWLRSHPVSMESSEWTLSGFLDAIGDKRLLLGKKEECKDSTGAAIYKAVCL